MLRMLVRVCREVDKTGVVGHICVRKDIRLLCIAKGSLPVLLRDVGTFLEEMTVQAVRTTFGKLCALSDEKTNSKHRHRLTT